MKPEDKARVWIDMKLRDAGWEVIDRNQLTPNSNAVAIREGLMEGNKESDYLLLVGGKAIGVVEAKKSDIHINNIKMQSQAEDYTRLLQKWYPTYEKVIPFAYVSNGQEIAFKDVRIKDSEFAQQKDFHRPRELLKSLGIEKNYNSFPFLDPKGLRTCQFEAIQAFENSIKSGKKRALMVLATGAGKTFTSCMVAYRMLNYTPVKRVLYLVDRNNLGSNALDNFSRFSLTEKGQVFTDIHAVEKLTSKPLNEKTKVYISTIQRLYSQLTGEAIEYSEEDEDNRKGHKEGDIVEIPENPRIPSDFFDLIIIDECHRSIYSDWQKVLSYFNNAFLLGLTATPISETNTFFENNQVSDYTLEKSIVDGVNVPHRIYRIATDLGEHGGEVQAGTQIEVTSRETNRTEIRDVKEDTTFSKGQLNRSIIVEDNIRKVLQHYKDVVYSELYPEREPNFDYLPKTLIFATSEAHAQTVVRIAKEVFDKTNDEKFVQRITYSVGNSQDLIKSFNIDKEFRIAVTVTLVATGTDVPPLEVLIFLNDVRSDVLYRQMKGRGVRTIKPDALQKVTPNAYSKDLFFLIDAVGVTESEKVTPSPSDTVKRPFNPTLEQLIEQMSLRYIPDDYLQLLAGKLSRIGNCADKEDLDRFYEIANFNLLDLAKRIFDALEKSLLPEFISANEGNTERVALVSELLNNVPARKKLIEIAKGYVKVTKETPDNIQHFGFSMELAKKSIEEFESYVQRHRDRIEALRLIYNNEVGQLTSKMLKDLETKLREDLPGFNSTLLWGDYERLNIENKGIVKPLIGEQVDAITNLIQLVRFAYKQITTLYAIPTIVAKHFELWCGQKQRDFSMTPEQKLVFKKIAEYIAMNGSIQAKDLLNKKPDLLNALLRMFKSMPSANEQIASLNQFILKVA